VVQFEIFSPGDVGFWVEGLLVYHDGATSLLGVPFDLRSWKITGEPIVLVENVAVGPNGGQRAALSHSGSLVYMTADGRGDTTSRPLAVSDSWEHDNAAISPDGQWVVYSSNESGSWQLYLQAFPGPGPRYPITVDGGDQAVWAPDGRTIYYSLGRELYEATVALPNFAVARRRLFSLPTAFGFNRFYRGWDLAPDGSHFLVINPEAVLPQRMVWIHNWREIVRQRAAAAGSAH
jgi:hypothetical protein